MDNIQDLLTKFINMENDYQLTHIDTISWLAKDYGFKYRHKSKRICVSYSFQEGKTFTIIYDKCFVLAKNNIPFILTHRENTLIYDGYKFTEIYDFLDWHDTQKMLTEINNYPEYQEKFKLFKLMEII